MVLQERYFQECKKYFKIHLRNTKLYVLLMFCVLEFYIHLEIKEYVMKKLIFRQTFRSTL